MRNYSRLLDKHNKKVISEIDLFQLLGSETYESYYDAVQELIAVGLISPVKASGLNGRIPSLFNRYRINKSNETDRDMLMAEIRGLHPSLSINKYLSDIQIYRKHKDIITEISRYLWEKQQELKQAMSVNERSFAIFRNEKLLAQNRLLVQSILAYNGMDWGVFNCYDTPEPFFSWQLGGIDLEDGAALVLENKDIWFTLVRISEELNADFLFPDRIVLLIYGEGNKITRPRDGLQEYLVRYFNRKFKAVYYAGDVDVEGISIYQRLKISQKSLLIKPFLPIYREMYAWAGHNRNIEGFALPLSRDKRSAEVDIESFLMESEAQLMYNKVELVQLADAIKKGGMIPQETVNRHVLLKLLNGESEP